MGSVKEYPQADVVILFDIGRFKITARGLILITGQSPVGIRMKENEFKESIGSMLDRHIALKYYPKT